MRVGVLALQGDFSKHVEVLRSLGVEVQEVRKPEELTMCEGLIIPGGESTVMFKQMQFIDMSKHLVAFAKQKPVFGTCAGLILMAKNIQESPLQPLQLLDVTIERNAFGRQVESFQAFVPLELTPEHVKVFPAFFIRAPRIRAHGPHVRVLATFEEEPILIQQGHHLGASFHPELTTDPVIHQYFLELIKKNHA